MFICNTKNIETLPNNNLTTKYYLMNYYGQNIFNRLHVFKLNFMFLLTMLSHTKKYICSKLSYCNKYHFYDFYDNLLDDLYCFVLISKILLQLINKKIPKSTKIYFYDSDRMYIQKYKK